MLKFLSVTGVFLATLLFLPNRAFLQTGNSGSLQSLQSQFASPGKAYGSALMGVAYQSNQNHYRLHDAGV